MKIAYFLETDSPVFVTEFGFNELNKPKTVGPYVRNTYILHYVLNGTCHFDGFEATAGEAFLISKNRLHYFKVDPGYSHVWATFNGEGAADLLKTFGLDAYSHKRLKVSDRDLADRLCSEYKEKVLSNSDRNTAKSWLYAMLPLLSDPDAQLEKTNPNILRAAQYLEQNCHRKITMQELADVLHVSEKHFCKLFRKQFGIPPQEFLINTRMEKARQLLAATDLKVKEIAGSVGYSSQLVFSQSFKKRYNTSPTAYRQSRKKVQ